jgi:hypothetical protein
MDGIEASGLSVAGLERNFSDIHVSPQRKRAETIMGGCATDWLLDSNMLPFKRARSSVKTIAVVSADPRHGK